MLQQELKTESTQFQLQITCWFRLQRCNPGTYEASISVFCGEEIPQVIFEAENKDVQKQTNVKSGEKVLLTLELLLAFVIEAQISFSKVFHSFHLFLYFSLKCKINSGLTGFGLGFF